MEQFSTAVQSALQTAPVCLTVQALLIHCSTKPFELYDMYPVLLPSTLEYTEYGGQ